MWNNQYTKLIAITLLILPVVSGHCSSAETIASLSEADYAAHVKELRKKAPENQFTIVIAKPFVVIGDETPAEVKRWAEGTVAWSVKMLKKAYFDKDPRDILDIWLFKDDDSYRRNAVRLFHKEPDTPYGYYSARDRALVMNISTGGGTLVHEIVHPFMAANFPDCPAWFNEGLGSLYEQCGEKNGQIHGYTNWRLSGLQKIIREKQLSSFKTLCSSGSSDFYEKDKGANYAQARYLCYYLQEHDLLTKFYRRFYKNRRDDPTGYETLKTVLGRNDMDKFQQEWEEYVLKLRFPD